MPSVRAFIHIFLLLCTISSGTSQDCPPLTAGTVRTLLNQLLQEGSPSLNSFTPVCLAGSFSINRYRHAAVAVNINFTSPPLSYFTGLFEVRCLNENWSSVRFNGAPINNTDVFNLPLLQNCSDCNVMSGPTLQCVRKLLLQ